MKVEEFFEPKECEKYRNILSKALDEIGIPYAHIKDRLLTEFLMEVCLAKV